MNQDIPEAETMETSVVGSSTNVYHDDNKEIGSIATDPFDRLLFNSLYENDKSVSVPIAWARANTT